MAPIKRTPVTSRRTLSGLGAVGIVAGTIAITAGLSAPSAHAATSKALAYDCSATVFGTTIPQGVWTATVSSDLPSQVAPGAKLPAPKITAQVTSSVTATDTLRALGETKVDGTSDANYTVTGAVANPGARTAGLSLPNTAVPATGALRTTATGNGAAETASSSPGTITVKVDDFKANIQTYKGSTEDLLIPVTCTLQAGQNATLGTIAVSATTTSPTTEPTSPTSTPTGTGTATSTDTGTATGTSTATGTATSTTTSTDVSGPPIITDGGSSDGGGLNGSALGGAAVAAAGIGALGFGLRRRLNSRK